MIKKKLIFGTQCLGSYLNEKDSLSLLDHVYDFGIKKFDCAERYPFPEKNETFGLTEEIIGNWSKKNRIRKSILLDTKVTGRNFGEIKSVGGKRLIPKRIISAAEKSLKRLKTDYIDTFYIHWPDRFTNNFDRLYYFPSNDP